MRVILQNGRLGAERFEGLPEDVAGFYNLDDYSTGPLADWDDPAAFAASRAAYLGEIGALDLPDGSRADYRTWMQFLPWYDWQTQDPTVEWPYFFEFDDVIGSAPDIEIWVEEELLRGRLFFWSTVAALDQRGIGPERVRVCRFPKFGGDKKAAGVWEALYLDQARRVYPAEDISGLEWARMITLWKAICALPEAPDAAALAEAPGDFALMQGRALDADGMNNIRWRLLRAAPVDWTKMARVVGDAMGAGWDVGDNVGDSVLQHELECMARLPEPLVEINGSGAMRFCALRLTQAGRAMLAGSGRCPTCPTDKSPGV